MNDIYSLNKTEWLNMIAEYNVACNNDGVVQDYYEHDLHNGKWKIIPLSFCGVATKIAKKYMPYTLSVCDNWDTLTASIHILEPGCEVYEHIDDDFETVIDRFHIPLFGFSTKDIQGSYKAYKQNDGVSIFKFDTTVPHTAKNTHPYNIVFLIIDFENRYQPVDSKVKADLFKTYTEAGYFS